MSERRDLWMPVLLAVGAAAVFAWDLAEGRALWGVVALLLGWAGAVACLPLRIKRGQGRMVAFGTGVALLLVPFAPGAAPDLLAALPWVVVSLALLVPVPRLPQRVRAALLVAAAVLAILGLLGVLGVAPRPLAWLLLAGAFHLALQVVHARPHREPAAPPGPRICVFGGSFDPFHRGHRTLCEAALKVVDRLLVVPAGRPPHKPGEEATPFHHRFAMARLGVEGLGRTEVLQLEGRRAGPSYTVDTLEALRASHPPGARFLLLLGADMLGDFPTWHAWERILDQATLLVGARPRAEVAPPSELGERGARIEVLEAPRVDVSSTEIRRALGAGGELGDLVSPAVQAYVREHGLYAGSASTEERGPKSRGRGSPGHAAGPGPRPPPPTATDTD